MLAGAVCLVLFHCSGVKKKNKPLFVGQFRNWRKDLKHVQNPEFKKFTKCRFFPRKFEKLIEVYQATKFLKTFLVKLKNK